MNIDNIDNVLEEYYSTVLERNDLNKINISPQYIESHRQEMEDKVNLFTLYTD